MRAIAAFLFALALLVPATAGAQRAPTRPTLPAAADTNDWESYYDRGVEHLRERQQVLAEAHFYWASRVDPSRAEPHYGRWVAFWARDPERYVRYLDGEKHVIASPDVLRSDSVRMLAFDRNPVLFQGLQVLILDQLTGMRWRNDPITLGWLAYATLRFPRAKEQFQRSIDRDPGRNAWVRYYRALVFAAEHRYDSASTEVERLLTDLRSRDDTSQVQHEYISKAFLEYAVGRLANARGDTAAATAALGRALSEDLSFAPAHEWLGRLALSHGDAAGAVTELAQAVELRPADGTLQFFHGRALAIAGRDAEAIPALRRAIELEPFWADPWFSLALALDRQSQPAEALATYRGYLARAPRSAPSLARARSRIDALSAAAPPE